MIQTADQNENPQKTTIQMKLSTAEEVKNSLESNGEEAFAHFAGFPHRIPIGAVTQWHPQQPNSDDKATNLTSHRY